MTWAFDRRFLPANRALIQVSTVKQAKTSQGKRDLEVQKTGKKTYRLKQTKTACGRKTKFARSLFVVLTYCTTIITVSNLTSKRR